MKTKSKHSKRRFSSFRKGSRLPIVMIIVTILLISGSFVAWWKFGRVGSVYLRIETDKDVYNTGENVTIRLVLVNDKDEDFSFMYKTNVSVYDSNGQYIFSDTPGGVPEGFLITLPAHSEKEICDGVWDQICYTQSGKEPASPGVYKVCGNFWSVGVGDPPFSLHIEKIIRIQ